VPYYVSRVEGNLADLGTCGDDGRMDIEGFKEWLDGTDLALHSKQNAISHCLEIEPLLGGDLDKVVCDSDRMEDALDWLKDHTDEYVLKGRLKEAGAAARQWALRKYAAFFHTPEAMSAKAGG
jgi:hypothetical protein